MAASDYRLQALDASIERHNGPDGGCETCADHNWTVSESTGDAFDVALLALLVAHQRGDGSMRRPQRLSASFVRTVKVPGRYGHGRGGFGLSLLVKEASVDGRLSKSWSQRLRIDGKTVNIGLGAYPVLTFANAEEKALENLRMVKRGVDPRKKAESGAPSFERAAEIVIELHKPSWKESSNSEQVWRQSLRDYAYPVIGDLPVDAVDHAHMLEILLPIWTVKRQTAQRLRARLRTILDWSISNGHRKDNPAGKALTKSLPKNGHHQAKGMESLPHREIAAALVAIRETPTIRPVVKLALEFIAHAATRSGETRNARWQHVNMAERTWTIPADHAKTGRPHMVPLSDRAVAVLDEAKAIAGDAGWLFPTPRGLQLPSVALMRGLRSAGINAQVHGFRASFRSWCADTGVDRELAESALAHAVGGTEGAYQRSTMVKRRRSLMADWSEYITTT